jgi:hypothetical protein
MQAPPPILTGLPLKIYELVLTKVVPRLIWTHSIRSLDMAKTKRELEEVKGGQENNNHEGEEDGTTEDGNDATEKEKRDSKDNKRRQVLPIQDLTVDMCTAMLIMLVFGTVSPMISMICAISLWAKTALQQAMIGAFLGTVSVAKKSVRVVGEEGGPDAELVDSIMRAHEQFKFDCNRSPATLWKSRYFFAFVLALSHGFFTLDIFADSVSSGSWVGFLVYFLLFVVCEVVFGYFRRQQAREGTTDDAGDVEMAIDSTGKGNANSSTTAAAAAAADDDDDDDDDISSSMEYQSNPLHAASQQPQRRDDGKGSSAPPLHDQMEDQNGFERSLSHHTSNTSDSGGSSNRKQSTDMRMASVITSTTLTAGLSLASSSAKKALLLGKRSSTRRRSAEEVAGGAIDTAAPSPAAAAAAAPAAGTTVKCESGGDDCDLTAAATAPAATAASSEPEMEYQCNPLHSPFLSVQSIGGLVVNDEGASAEDGTDNPMPLPRPTTDDRHDGSSDRKT